MFRAIGGYVPVKGGSIDHIAVITARMKGWRTRTFTEIVCLHHRAMGTAQQSLEVEVQARHQGLCRGKSSVVGIVQDRASDDHVPVGVGGMALGTGYFWALLRRFERPVSRDLIDFHRREQMQRLKNFFTGNMSSTKILRPPVRPVVGLGGQQRMLATSKNLASVETVSSSAQSLDGKSSQSGVLIVNADDWGRDAETTDRILECVQCGAVSSASAMVFMEDSERAAALASEFGVDVGLHLNFTTRFSASSCSPRLVEHQQRLHRYLWPNRFAQVVFHPGLAGSFGYLVAAQLEEFHRLYGVAPDRIDGHHHMHLCANVLLAELMPAGTLVRRNFSFAPGEKSWINLLYRKSVDRRLKRRHRLVDYLFSLAPVEPVDRLQRIVSLARHAIVELETHPVNPDEYRVLTRCEALKEIADVRHSHRSCVAQ